MQTVSTRKVAPVLIGLLLVAGTAAVFLRGSMLTASLTPTVSPGTASGFTLEDIWSKIANNTYTAVSGHAAMAPSDTPSSPTLRHTVDQIFQAIPTLSSGSIKSGVAYFGVTGAYPSAAYPLPTTGSTGTPATTSNILSNYFALSTTGAVLQGSATAGGPPYPSCAPSGTYPTNTDNCAATSGSHYSFATDANGVLEVADSATNLIWAKCPLGQTGDDCSGGSTLNATLDGSDSNPSAEADCEALNTGGVTGWRLPTIAELSSIVDYNHSQPAINRTYFPNTPADDYFWSSSPYVDYPGNFWLVNFYDGGTLNDDPSYTIDVRCVRPAM